MCRAWVCAMVDRILSSRRVRQLRLDDLARLKVPLRKASPFLILPDHRPTLLIDRGPIFASWSSRAPRGRWRCPLPEMVLDGPADFAGWRKAARRLVANGGRAVGRHLEDRRRKRRSVRSADAVRPGSRKPDIHRTAKLRRAGRPRCAPSRRKSFQPVVQIALAIDDGAAVDGGCVRRRCRTPQSFSPRGAAGYSQDARLRALPVDRRGERRALYRLV